MEGGWMEWQTFGFDEEREGDSACLWVVDRGFNRGGSYIDHYGIPCDHVWDSLRHLVSNESSIQQASWTIYISHSLHPHQILTPVVSFQYIFLCHTYDYITHNFEKFTRNIPGAIQWNKNNLYLPLIRVTFKYYAQWLGISHLLFFLVEIAVYYECQRPPLSWSWTPLWCSPVSSIFLHREAFRGVTYLRPKMVFVTARLWWCGIGYQRRVGM